MESKRKNYNEMYEYVNKGSTLYDFLGEYLDIDDFSAKVILNSLRRDLNMQQMGVAESSKAKFIGLVNTYNKDIHGRIVDSMRERISRSDREKLLKKLQEVNPKEYNFPDLLHYINFLEEANFTQRAIVKRDDDETEALPTLNPDIEKLNTILIDTAVEKADPELVGRIRNVLIHMMLIPYVKKQILKENPETDLTKNPKLKQIELLRKIFSNQKSVAEYDNAIAYSAKREEEAVSKARIETDCKMRRLAAIADYTGKPMTEILKAADSNEYIIDLIANPNSLPKITYKPKEGDYYWSFVANSKPEVVLNEPVEFSKDGIENQDIAVISYGDFMYGKNVGFSRFDEFPMKLIGVTVFGKDENKNYFLVTPEGNIRDMQNRKNIEYYKKVLLSTYTLDETVAHRDKFLPEISIDENGDAKLEYEKEFSMLDLNPLDALKYANSFPGFLGRESGSSTLQNLCNSPKLFELQMQLLYDLRNKNKQSQDNIREDY